MLVPPVAIPLYLFFGTRKFPRRASRPRTIDEARRGGAPTEPIQRIVWSAGLPAASGGNTFEVLESGERAYQRLIALIQSARASVHMTMFILGNDDTGRGVLAALVERARAGVEVRVILDAVGSAGTMRSATRELTPVGGAVRAFMPLIHAPLRGYSNLRSHRKLAVIDGVSIFTGGMNLAVEYMGPTPLEGRWRDIAVVASGPVASDADALFAADWAFCGGDASTLRTSDVGSVPRSGDTVLQVVHSGPDVADDALYDALLTAVFAAKDRVAIVTPYYVPDELLQRALILAARRGVRTELVLPARSNHMLADFARRGFGARPARRGNRSVRIRSRHGAREGDGGRRSVCIRRFAQHRHAKPLSQLRKCLVRVHGARRRAACSVDRSAAARVRDRYVRSRAQRVVVARAARAPGCSGAVKPGCLSRSRSRSRLRVHLGNSIGSRRVTDRGQMNNPGSARGA